MRKITRNNINKENMVTLSYCQCQTILNMFAYNYKVGYNAGIYGWNYDLYRINNVDIVYGYSVPYHQYSNRKLKKQLITLENEVNKEACNFDNFNKWSKEFFEIFK